jgi:serine/threonine protein kinase HipA of HipAB toxin-antitoxin module
MGRGPYSLIQEAGVKEEFKAVLERHPLPWRVTEAYKAWNASGSHGESPPAIVDALYHNGLDYRHANYADVSANDKHIVVSSSEWLGMEVDVAEMIVARVNGEGDDERR